MKTLSTLLTASLLAASPLASAATFTVTSLADSGTGSLRNAIAQANATAVTDTIVFQPGLNGTIAMTSELLVTENLAINGPGADRVTLDAQRLGRALHFDNPTGAARSWTISGLTVTNGLANATGNDNGGGLYYESPAFSSIRPALTLSNMAFAGNEAARTGGAISVSGADLVLSDTTVLDNTVRNGFQPSGGGLFFNRGLVRIERCWISGNTADLIGGGINFASPGVSAIISDSLVQQNQASLSGAGMHAGTMSSMTISRSAFIDNVLTSQPQGAGIYFAAVTDPGSPTNVIENSTFSGNVSLSQSGRGSALAVVQGNMTVRNSTFAFNKTAPNFAPDPNSGGALWVSNGNTTSVTVQSTLFEGNTHGNTLLPSDLVRLSGGSPGSSLSVDHCAFPTLPAAGVITAFGSGNLEVEAQLLPLSYSAGGLTPTHALPKTSPVIDRGSNPGNLMTDQRGAGFTRGWSDPDSRNGAPDIGAYEVRGDAIFVGDFEQH
jgi:hypothetical protein